ncbi:SDR family NAD(P)-dependent oxidoreductase [Dyadobacter pollutisoli]|jgi:short-subunit dehydrogenase|uniref:SDR family NAD(P)-dependent oxidoreductase n=1 Tax=Dyadobacter pollutisoli TaxID=2910158 RepID=A0A9E8NGL5_9BACT|nr:SDR family NAD(P)-dependent oxidoreductase [Dyadobacter pollutisoli]WAC14632.1 SDR family NAD(P)-dependent oxidoreductase [Dyadobacter pollutisoli]
MSNILMTGGTGNLGKSVVETLSAAGYHLHLSVREINEPGTDKISYYQTDLESPGQSENLVKSVLDTENDILAGVFLAGGFVPGGLEKTGWDDISKMISLNFATAFNTAQSLLAHFRQKGAGKLIFVGAKAAMDSGSAINNVAYSLSKQLLFNFSEMVNESENKNGITSHILLPGTLDTALNRGFMPDADFSKWTSTIAIAETISDIIGGQEIRSVISF